MSNGSVGRLATFEIGLVVGSVGRSECFAHQSSGGGSAIGSAAVGQIDGWLCWVQANGRADKN